MEIKAIFLKAISRMVKKADVTKKFNNVKDHIRKTIKFHQMERQKKFGQNQKRPHDLVVEELRKVEELL